MPYKNLLVHADLGRAAPSTLAVACQLAAAHHAHLAAVHIIPRHSMPAYVEAELPPEVIRARDRVAGEVAERARAMVETAGRGAGVEAEWIAARGDMPESVLPFARRVDLTVVGQPGTDSIEERLSSTLAEALLLGSGRPVLLVPRFGQFARVGERVLIGWAGTREAARAVNDAIPLLVSAREVTVLSVNPPAESDVPSGDIAMHLARHGIKATAAAARGEQLAVGDVLLSRAADLGADLIVMGGYGHSRIREMALGGATRHLLEHMTVPVLMSH